MKYRYMAYKNGKLFAWANNQKVLAKMIGASQAMISDAVLNKKKIYEEYTIIKKEVENYKRIPEIYKEWDEVVKPFKNVEWVKEGGRKLAVQKRD